MRYLPTAVFAVLATVFGGLYLLNQAPEPKATSGEGLALPAAPAVDRETQIRLSKLETQLDASQREVARLKQQLKEETAGGDYDSILGSFDSGDEAAIPAEVNADEIAKTVADQVSKIVTKSMSFGGKDTQALMREQMKLQSVMKVEKGYRDLFREFGLAPDEEQRLKDLLVEKKQSGMMFFGGEATDQRSKDEIEAEIQSFLSEDAYAKYQHYDKTSKARGSVSKLQRELADLDVPMTREQRESMVDIMHANQSTQTKSPVQIDLGDNALGGVVAYSINLDGSANGDLGLQMEESLEKRAEEYDKILSESAEVLNQEQLDGLATHFDDQMQRKERQSDMTKAMMPNIVVEGLGENGAIQGGSMKMIIGGSSSIQIQEDE